MSSSDHFARRRLAVELVAGVGPSGMPALARELVDMIMAATKAPKRRGDATSGADDAQLVLAGARHVLADPAGAANRMTREHGVGGPAFAALFAGLERATKAFAAKQPRGAA